MYVTQYETGSDIESGRLVQPQHSPSTDFAARGLRGRACSWADRRGDPAGCSRRLTKWESQQEWASRSRSRAGCLRRSRVEVLFIAAEGYADAKAHCTSH